MIETKGLIYIVDDDPSFRDSLERLVRVAGYATDTFPSAAAFLALPSFKRPACLLLDVDMPEFDGLALQKRLVGQGASLPIIFITGRGNIPMSVKAMKAGALDFFTKPIEGAELLAAIDKALAQERHHLKTAKEQRGVERRVNTLTPRELEVLRWVIAGKINRHIASEMGIALKTVKLHRGKVMEKMKVSSVAELVRLSELAGIPPADCS